MPIYVYHHASGPPLNIKFIAQTLYIFLMKKRVVRFIRQQIDYIILLELQSKFDIFCHLQFDKEAISDVISEINILFLILSLRQFLMTFEILSRLRTELKVMTFVFVKTFQLGLINNIIISSLFLDIFFTKFSNKNASKSGCPKM